MANLTVAIDDELLKRARIKALEQGTSVNAVVREHLERYAGEPDPDAAIARLFELADRVGWTAGGWTWNRDELHHRR